MAMAVKICLLLILTIESQLLSVSCILTNHNLYYTDAGKTYTSTSKYHSKFPEVVPGTSKTKEPINMSRQYSLVKDITEELKKKWTVVFQVVECGNVQENDTTKYRRILFTDTEGTKVSALIFEANLTFFENVFEPFKRYCISNASLMKTKARYIIGDYAFTWKLTKRTLVEPHLEQFPPPLPCNFTFTPFTNLYKNADTEHYQDIRGIVLKCFLSHQITQGEDGTSRRDIIIVNEEKKLISLTLWNSFNKIEGQSLEQIIDDAPMIYALRVKATTFYGMSLTTSKGSAILINPPVVLPNQLQTWFNNNRMELSQLLESESYKNLDHLLPYPQEDDIVQIARGLRLMNNGKPIWVRGNVMLPNQEQSFTQTCCSSCLKKIEADTNWVITCPWCKKNAKVNLTSRATFEINDDTGSIAASVTTPIIDKFISLDPLAIKDAEDKGQDVGELIGSSLFKVKAVAFIRAYKSKQHQQTTTRYVIVNAYKVPDVMETSETRPNAKVIENLSINKSPSPKNKPKRSDSDPEAPDAAGPSSTISQRTKRMK